jgi:hypothetical protein
MSDWPADPKLDDGLRSLMDDELAASRTALSGREIPRHERLSRRRTGQRAGLSGVALVSVLVIAAGLLVRGGVFGRGGASGESPSGFATEGPTASPSPTETVAPTATSTPTPSPSPLPAVGKLTPTGTPVGNSTAVPPVLLKDGRVFFVNYPGASIYDPKTGKFHMTGDPKARHPTGTATLLADGRVLLVGGRGETADPNEWKVSSSAEIYDPASGTFSKTGALNVARDGQTSALLADGKVLIAGGNRPPESSNEGQIVMLDSAELYDPATGRFTLTAPMTTGRDYATATSLQDGRVLIVGGGDEGHQGLDSAEIYDPATNNFALTGSMSTPRYSHQALLLKDGRVLVVAGTDGQGPLATTQVFDPMTGKFGRVVTPGTDSYAAGPLPDGRVLLMGGYDVASLWDDIHAGTKDTQPDAGWLLYDPATDELRPAVSPGHPGWGIVLADGRVLDIGGDGAALLFSLS